MKNIHILPTDQPSRLVKRLVKIKDTFFLTTTDDIPGGTFYNIYITSSEEIGEGDWVLNISNNKIFKQDSFKPDAYTLSFYKKIIITTDPTLIADGVQAIDDDFLQWFVKNPGCEGVEVQKWTNYSEVKYKIIIPQEEPKQESHICKYCNAETTQPDDECYAKPKQETLEEAAERHYINCIPSDRHSFIAGAKWQAERMYSSLSKARNELYDKLPTGDIDAFELLKLIKIHLQKLDVLCGNK